MPTEQIDCLTVVFGNEESRHKGKGIPVWNRTCFYDERTQDLYLPLALVASSSKDIQQVFAIFAANDGEPLICKHGHYYARVPYLIRLEPDRANVFSQIASNVLRKLAKEHQ